ncbi:MAG: hypothetical protein KGJ92_05775 [Actinomycetales bacterium]|nr:hypothetical protein [Actinomycetales bacterium]
MRRTRSALTWLVTSALTLAVAVGVVAATAHPSGTTGAPSVVTSTTGPAATTTTPTPPSSPPTSPPTTIVRYGGDDGSSYGGSAPAYGDN